MNRIETTLLLLRKDNQVMLAMKKQGFGEGKFNGVGGKLEADETPEMAMIRETQEEILVTPTDYSKVGVMEFVEFYKGTKANVLFHLFVSTNWIGEPQESEEMKPYWFDLDKIPYDQMFEDYKYWLHYALEGKKINGFFEYDENWKLLSHKIDELKVK
ncbi:MAG: 8-oxo-dGTP diphosphatase [Bacilli bacterium]|nr:8-oxo-dGTP diphosphatase [Bacilli bacterium]MDD4298180.1 8-oxo-dGTP diphosphatase [Bacilli bacterium]MDD4643426.1 8-oxo-dGTP diphosphatase [Bacilli bacterium]